MVSLLRVSDFAIIANEMNQESVIADIEQKARAAGVSISALCNRAGVHPTTFSRWKKSARNPEPMGASLLAIGKIYNELEKLAPKRARRATKVAA